MKQKAKLTGKKLNKIKSTSFGKANKKKIKRRHKYSQSGDAKA